MKDKVNKIRTSITINPEVLAKAKAVVEAPGSDYKSVAALIELALVEKLNQVS